MKKIKRAQPRVCPRLRHRKTKGDWAELAFMSKAVALGFTVCRPYGDNHLFDFLVFAPLNRISRVQVKSCWSFNHAYQLNSHRAHYRRYRAADLDFIIGYVVPYDAWYVIPLDRVIKPMIALFPHVPRSRGKYERFREAWHLLRLTSSQNAEVRLQK